MKVISSVKLENLFDFTYSVFYLLASAYLIFIAFTIILNPLLDPFTRLRADPWFVLFLFVFGFNVLQYAIVLVFAPLIVSKPKLYRSWIFILFFVFVLGHSFANFLIEQMLSGSIIDLIIQNSVMLFYLFLAVVECSERISWKASLVKRSETLLEFVDKIFWPLNLLNLFLAAFFFAPLFWGGMVLFMLNIVSSDTVFLAIPLYILAVMAFYFFLSAFRMFEYATGTKIFPFKMFRYASGAVPKKKIMVKNLQAKSLFALISLMVGGSIFFLSLERLKLPKPEFNFLAYLGLALAAYFILSAWKKYNEIF